LTAEKYSRNVEEDDQPVKPPLMERAARWSRGS